VLRSDLKEFRARATLIRGVQRWTCPTRRSARS